MKKSVIFGAVFLVLTLLASHFAFSATDTVPSPVPITKIKKTTYIYAGTLVASKSTDNPLKTQYYIQDHLGSNMKVLENGIPEQTNKYYAFGETTTTPPESDYPYRFTGKEYDSETQLYYYGARYYKPELGRFIQADALRGSLEDPLSLNRYAYVKNNPLKYVDPSGNWAGAVGGARYRAYQAQQQEQRKKTPQFSGVWGPLSSGAVWEGPPEQGISEALGPADIAGAIVGGPAVSRITQWMGNLASSIFRNKILKKVVSEVVEQGADLTIETTTGVGGTINRQGKLDKSKTKEFLSADVLYRGDSRHPSTIFKEGFTIDNVKATESMGPVVHVSPDRNFAKRFPYGNEEKYLYYIDESNLDARIDMDASMHPVEDLPFAEPIEPKHILGARKVNAAYNMGEDGYEYKLGKFIPNPNYGGK